MKQDQAHSPKFSGAKKKKKTTQNKNIYTVIVILSYSVI